MKHLKFLLPITFTAACFLITACQKDSLFSPVEETAKVSARTEASAPEQAISSKHHAYREIPFKAKFSTNRVPEKLGDVVCLNPDVYDAPNYQEGGGTATHLGRFNTVLTFCSTAGGFYGGATGYFEAANGDRLYIKINDGQVKLILPPGSDPFYDAYFQDPFEFCGGTGRFEDATGGGMTDSLVDLWDGEEYPLLGPIIPDHLTDHVWTGTLILPNGNE